MYKDDKYLDQLKEDVEERVQRHMLSPKDFTMLHHYIFDHLNENVSESTLKRLWGYCQYQSRPSAGILSALSRLVGFLDWVDYKKHRFADAPASQEVLNDHINVKADLKNGDVVRLTWSPLRVCDIKYRGNGEFEVLSSANTAIKPGNLFSCDIIVSGEPLWLSNLRQFGKQPVAYVCGKRGGVRFEILE